VYLYCVRNLLYKHKKLNELCVKLNKNTKKCDRASIRRAIVHRRAFYGKQCVVVTERRRCFFTIIIIIIVLYHNSAQILYNK